MPLITTLANAGARGFGFSGVGAPSAPTIGTATASSTTSATVNYTAPSSNGGSPIVSYTAVAVPGGQTGTVVRSGSGSITVSGLTSGVSYQFYVYATNAVGDSPNSALSNSMTTAAVPGAPIIGMAYATGTTTATVDYTAPASDGGSAITSYTAVASPGGQTATVYRSGSGSISISGLSSRTTYQFRVYASNAYGSSLYSGYSNSVTTQAPFAVSVSPRTGSANIAKVSTAITSYGSFTVTATGGSGTVSVQETSRPTGGSTTISPSSFTLSAGQSQVVNVSCTSPTGIFSNTEYYYDFSVDAFGQNPSYTFTQYRS